MSRLFLSKWKRACLVLIAGALVSVSANAATIKVFTPATGTLDGQKVDATATFVTSSGSLSVTLENNIIDPASVIQNISGLRFTLSTGQTSGSLIFSSGMERTILVPAAKSKQGKDKGKDKDKDKDGDDGGSTTGSYIDGSTGSTGWGLRSPASGMLELHVLGTDIGPAHTIIGAPGANGIYNNANGSIAGNKPHNAFLAGPVTFTLSIPGVTADSTITGATFLFGTSAEPVRGFVPSIPLPAACWTGMALLAGLAVARKLRRHA